MTWFLGGLFVFLFAVILIDILDQGYEGSLTLNGIQNFFKFFQIPLYVLALNISALGLLNAIFKSGQTHLQIKNMNDQNIELNTRQHYTDFVNEITRIEKLTSIKTKMSLKQFWGTLFCLNHGYIIPRTEHFEAFKMVSRKINKLTPNLPESSHISKENLNDIIVILEEFYVTYHIEMPLILNRKKEISIDEFNLSVIKTANNIEAWVSHIILYSQYNKDNNDIYKYISS